MPTVKEHDDLAPVPVVDASSLGDKLVGARYSRGFRNAAALAAAMRSRCGVSVSERQYLSYERGERRIPFDVLVAFAEIVQPDGGIAFLANAIHPDHRPAWLEFVGDE